MNKQNNETAETTIIEAGSIEETKEETTMEEKKGIFKGFTDGCKSIAQAHNDFVAKHPSLKVVEGAGKIAAGVALFAFGVKTGKNIVNNIEASDVMEDFVEDIVEDVVENATEII